MKKIAVATVLLASALSWAGTDPNPAEYSINVHVSSSRMVIAACCNISKQMLSVVIDGKKYELEESGHVNALLALGDYKAKLFADQHRTAYDSFQTYEFLFPDKKTRKFDVVGQIE
jgi:type 1 fimbria pilin